MIKEKNRRFSRFNLKVFHISFFFELSSDDLISHSKKLITFHLVQTTLLF